MSIRQQGGVFGRNPKFGTVEADEFIGPVTGTATQADTVEITNNTTSGGTYYPALMTGTSGYGAVNVSSSKLAFQPSSGMLSPSIVNAGMTLANGPLTAFLSASGALYGYYSGGGVIASYSDNSATLSALTFDGSTIALRTGNTPALSLGASDVTVNKGNLVMATSGAGIDFSATAGTGTSELFDDYEEGTWTATLKGSVSDPTTPVTATGSYTKVGRLVTITCSFDGVDTTGASGDVTVTGLPYNNSTPYTRTGGVVSYVGNFPISNKYVGCGMDENATSVYFSDIAGIGFGASLQHFAGGGRYLRFAITYYGA